MGTLADRIDYVSSIGDLCIGGVSDISESGQVNLQEAVRRRVVRVDRREHAETRVGRDNRGLGSTNRHPYVPSCDGAAGVVIEEKICRRGWGVHFCSTDCVTAGNVADIANA